MAAIDGVARLGLSVRSLGGNIKSFMGGKGFLYWGMDVIQCL